MRKQTKAGMVGEVELETGQSASSLLADKKLISLAKHRQGSSDDERAFNSHR